MDGWQVTSHTFSGLEIGVPYRFYVGRSNRSSIGDHFNGYSLQSLSGAKLTGANNVFVPTSSTVTFTINSNINDSGYEKYVGVYVCATNKIKTQNNAYIYNGNLYTY